MRVVFMGTPDFAVPTLEAILSAGHEIAAVYTQPDKPVGRKQILTPPPVKVSALKQNIPVLQPKTLRDEDVQRELASFAPDCIVVVAYGKLLPLGVLEIPKWGCINVHGSLLPKYRGAAPIQWSVINGDELAGITTMYMAEGLDTGDMLLSKSTPIGAEETSGQLYERLAAIGAGLLVETLAKLETGNLCPQKQKDEEATHAPMLTKELAKIDFSKPAHLVVRHIHGMNPWPVAHTVYADVPLKVFSARVTEGKGMAGERLADKKGFVVACGEDAVELLTVQPAGKKQMAGADFLRGLKA